MEVITGRQNISDTDTDFTALNIRYGGLVIPNPSQQWLQQIRYYDFLADNLQKAITYGESFQSEFERKLKTSKHTAISHKMSHEKVKGKADKKMQRHLEILQTKRTSTYLTSLPFKQNRMYTTEWS